VTDRHLKPLRDLPWFPDVRAARRYLIVLVVTPASLAVVVAGLAAKLPAVWLPTGFVAVTCLAYMHLLALSVTQALKNNDVDVYWQYYKALWWLHLGGALPPARQVRIKATA
jgi:hypothetical protein